MNDEETNERLAAIEKAARYDRSSMMDGMHNLFDQRAALEARRQERTAENKQKKLYLWRTSPAEFYDTHDYGICWANSEEDARAMVAARSSLSARRKVILIEEIDCSKNFFETGCQFR